MKIIFKKAQTYKNEYVNIDVSDEDVKKGKVFAFIEKNAMSYIKSGCAVLAEEIKADEPPEDTGDGETVLSDLTIPKLKEYAATADPVIDLGDAKKKDEILAVIAEAEKDVGDVGDGGDSTAQNND